MDMFYENLGKVARGEWWIWPLSDTGTYKAKVTELAHGNSYEEDNFLYLACRLFFSCLTDIKVYHPFFIEIIRGASGLSIPMPAERFLEIYQGKAHQTDDPRDGSIEQRGAKEYYSRLFEVSCTSEMLMNMVFLPAV